MPDPAVQDVPVERGLELRAVVGLDELDTERQLLQDVVDERDRGLLVEPVVDPEHPQPGAVIDRGELVELLARAGQRGNELDVDLDLVTGLGLLVPGPPAGVALGAL